MKLVMRNLNRKVISIDHVEMSVIPNLKTETIMIMVVTTVMKMMILVVTIINTLMIRMTMALMMILMMQLSQWRT